MITIIAALAKNGALGFKNKLIYHLPADLKHFKVLTSGHTVIMGRRTFESLPKGALPNRRNIVLSRQEGLAIENAEVMSSLGEALKSCAEAGEEVFIIGGETLYKESLPLADRLCLTHIDDTPAEADVFFPEFDETEWQRTAAEFHMPDEKNPYPFSFVEYTRER